MPFSNAVAGEIAAGKSVLTEESPPLTGTETIFHCAETSVERNDPFIVEYPNVGDHGLLPPEFFALTRQ
jgi:hypothetical protein